MIMHRARLEDISLTNYIRNHVLSKEFVETRVDDSFSSVSGNTYQIVVPSSFEPNPFQRGRGIYYYDEITVSGVGPVTIDTSEQENRVSVTNTSLVVEPSVNYTVDYTSGKITTNGFTPLKVTYDYSYVSVLDAYPDTRESEKLSLPFVAIDSLGQDPLRPLEIGGGKIIRRPIRIHAYATSAAERDDIVQVLLNGLENRNIKLVNFNESNGFPLNYDGTYNSSYDPLQLEGAGRIGFENISYRNIPGTRDFTYGERYKSIVSLVLRVVVSKDSI